MFNLSAKKIIIVSGASVFLLACGGGGSGSSTGSAGNTTGITAQNQSVSGPLDSAQETISNAVSDIGSASGNAAVSEVLECVDQAVVGNVLDAGDGVLNTVGDLTTGEDPTAALTGLAGDLQNSVVNAVAGVVSTLVAVGSGGEADVCQSTADTLDELLAAFQAAQNGEVYSGGFGGYNGAGGFNGVQEEGVFAPTGEAGIDDLIGALLDSLINGFLANPSLESVSDLVGVLTAQLTALLSNLQVGDADISALLDELGGLAVLTDALSNLDELVSAVASLDLAQVGEATSGLVDDLLTGVLGVLSILGGGTDIGTGVTDAITSVVDGITGVFDSILNGEDPATVVSDLVDDVITVIGGGTGDNVLDDFVSGVTDGLGGLTGGLI